MAPVSFLFCGQQDTDVISEMPKMSQSSRISNFKCSEEGFEESTAGEDPSGTGDTYDDETDTDGESALEETEAASNVLLRYASRLVLPLDALLAEDGSSH